MAATGPGIGNGGSWVDWGMPSEAASPANPGATDWNALLAPYRKPVAWRAWFQVLNTAIPFFALWATMYLSLRAGYWLTLLLAVPTAMFLVRMFMFQHDCGHGAFTPSQKVNNVIGSLIGVLTLVPYDYWRKTHAVHHATSGNLDIRTFGDIDTLTVREYLSRSPGKRLAYRLYRHPLVLLVLGPVWQFIIKHRWPTDAPREWKREWQSVYWTNAVLLGVVAIMALTIGLKAFLLVQLPVTLLAGSTGVYLFYVQHQYEDTYWRYREAWNYYHAGLEGASHLVMPRWLQWFTANIGLHHIHHVSSRVPNYSLQRCYDENPEFHDVTRLTLPQSVGTLRLTLWDEEERKLVGFRDLPRIRARLAEPVLATKPEAVPKPWR
jgi:omega-6 fatty acid desaturase (delta-12 desaturase)